MQQKFETLAAQILERTQTELRAFTHNPSASKRALERMQEELKILKATFQLVTASE